MCIAFFIADEITIANIETKFSLSKQTHAKCRRHSSQRQTTYPNPAVLKIGEATALPVMLYHHWIQVQQPSQSDDDEPMQPYSSSALLGGSNGNNFPDEAQCAANTQKNATTWTSKKMSSEDASLHVTR